MPIRNGSLRANGGYARRMSSHLAAALILFCLLQIGIVARMGGSLVLHLGVIVAIGAFAVAARGLERRWERLGKRDVSPLGLAPRFRRDVARLWLASVLGGLLWIPVAILFRPLIS